MTAQLPPLMTSVESSHIDAVGHDHRGLFVRFKGGGLHLYPQGTKTLRDQMVKADSVGKFFHAHVKSLTNVKVDYA